MRGRQRRRARRADLSQHFLRKGATAKRLLDRAKFTREDVVVEVGPGRGALTYPVADRVKRVLAIELDAELAAALGNEAPANIKVTCADFLKAPLPDHAWKCIGNLPYAITTNIIRKLTNAPTPPSDAWLVVQSEAAQRFCGPPYRNETRWSLTLKPQWHIEIVDRLQRQDFDPPPSVDSVLLWMTRRGRPLLDAQETHCFNEMVTHAFERGESIGQSLRHWLTRRQVKRLAADLKFSADDKPPRLCFEQWLGLARFVVRPE